MRLFKVVVLAFVLHGSTISAMGCCKKCLLCLQGCWGINAVESYAEQVPHDRQKEVRISQGSASSQGGTGVVQATLSAPPMTPGDKKLTLRPHTETAGGASGPCVRPKTALTSSERDRRAIYTSGQTAAVSQEHQSAGQISLAGAKSITSARVEEPVQHKSIPKVVRFAGQPLYEHDSGLPSAQAMIGVAREQRAARVMGPLSTMCQQKLSNEQQELFRIAGSRIGGAKEDPQELSRIEEWIQKGSVDINARDPGNGKTVLCKAVVANRYKLVDLLLARHADISCVLNARGNVIQRVRREGRIQGVSFFIVAALELRRRELAALEGSVKSKKNGEGV